MKVVGENVGYEMHIPARLLAIWSMDLKQNASRHSASEKHEVSDSLHTEMISVTNNMKASQFMMFVETVS